MESVLSNKNLLGLILQELDTYEDWQNFCKVNNFFERVGTNPTLLDQRIWAHFYADRCEYYHFMCDTEQRVIKGRMFEKKGRPTPQDFYFLSNMFFPKKWKSAKYLVLLDIDSWYHGGKRVFFTNDPNRVCKQFVLSGEVLKWSAVDSEDDSDSYMDHCPSPLIDYCGHKEGIAFIDTRWSKMGQSVGMMEDYPIQVFIHRTKDLNDFYKI